LSLAFYGLAQYPNSALWPPLRCTRIIMLARFYYKRGAGRGGQTSANLTAFAWGRAVKSSSAAARVVALREESASLCLCVTLCACLCVPAHGQVAPHRQCRLAPSNCEAALLFSQSAQNLLRADYRYYYQLTNAEGRINISAADRAVSQLLAALSALGSLSRPIAYFAQARLLSSYSFARSIPRGVLVMRKTRRPYNAIRLLSPPPPPSITPDTPDTSPFFARHVQQHQRFVTLGQSFLYLTSLGAEKQRSPQKYFVLNARQLNRDDVLTLRVKMQMARCWIWSSLACTRA
jgi:hypothetical protein